MNKFLKIILISFFAVFLLNGIAMAAAFNVRPTAVGPPYGSEDSLQQILNNIIEPPDSISANNQDPAAIWSSTDANSTLISIAVFTEIGGTVGIYSFLDSTEYDLYSLATGPNPVDGSFSGFPELTIDASSSGLRLSTDPSTLLAGNFSYFGFYWEFDGVKAYTEDSKNGGDASALAYRVAGGIEINPDFYWDTSTLGTKPNFFAEDGDDWILAFDNSTNSNDFNDAVFYVKDMAPVPEPATMLLLGSGLLGLAAAGRRKFFKK